MLDQEVRDLYAEGFSPSEEVIQRLEWAVRDDSSVIFTDVWTAVKGE